MMMRKDTVTVVKSGFRHFREQSGDFLNIFRPRGFLAAHLRVRGVSVNVVNAHTNALSEDTPSRQAAPGTSPQRQRQMHEVFGEARSMPQSRVSLLMGDLNTTPDLGEIPNEEYAFQDAWSPSESQPCITWSKDNPMTGAFQETKDDLRLDYIFTHGPKMLRTKSDIVFNEAPWVSDHFGIRSVVSI
jgi:endonuclease/exonuclease/phosphatase family metal-dependent hydrolase